MTETETVTVDGTEVPVRADDGTLAEDFVDAVVEAVESEDREKVGALAGDLHSADVADLLEALPGDLRGDFVQSLGEDFDFAALTEVDVGVRDQLLEELPTETVAGGVAELDSDDAVYLLEDLEPEDRDEILEQLPASERAALKRSFDYPEGSAGRRMRVEFIAVPQFWTVGQTLDHLREADDLPDDFYEVFIVDPAYRLVGVVQLNRLLRSKRPTRLADILDETPQVIQATDDQEDVARRFERYDLISAAVVDEAGRLVGALTIDDMLDVIQEAADAEIKSLAGLGDSELSDTVFKSSRSRLPWLAVNTVTGFLAATVIGLFGGTIEQMVALAFLMPIVATLGGSAAVQAMTVTVRAIATRDFGRGVARRIVLREVAVGFVNGVAIALLVGVGAGIWFSNLELAFVIGAALIFNMLVAGFVGVLVPMTLNRMKFDPAVASGVFVTAVTDVVGFFAFLGLAAVWFDLL